MAAAFTPARSQAIPYRQNGRRTCLVLFHKFSFDTQRMRAASIGPHAGESYLLIGTFLKEETTIGGAEKENGKSTMKKTSVDVGHEVTYKEEDKPEHTLAGCLFFTHRLFYFPRHKPCPRE